MPKSMIFGTGLPSTWVVEDVGWLQIAVDDSLLVSMLNAAADLNKELQSVAYGEPMIVAVDG